MHIVIRATVGTWANYATSLAAQIIFADHFGSSLDASAFAIAFVIALTMSGLLVSAIQTVAVPRLTSLNGPVRRSIVHSLARVTCGAFLVAALCAAVAVPAATALSNATGLPRNTLIPLLVMSAGMLFVRFLAGEIGAVAYALGYRLIPSLAPAMPTTAMVGAFVVDPHIGVVHLFLVFLIASVTETVLIGAFVAARFRVVDEAADPIGTAALWMLGTYVLLSLLPLVERVAIGIHHAADVARYDYAIRSLGAAQQLIVGGVTVAAIATWSRMADPNSRGLLKRSVAVTSLVAGLLLAFSTAVFVAGGREIVAMVYQRGHFAAADTEAVTTVIDLALLGYCSFGVTTVMTSALAATRRTRDLVTIGVAHFAARLVLIIPLGAVAGAQGVAVAYSLGTAFGLVLVVLFIVRAGLWTMPDALVWPTVGAAAATVLAASISVSIGQGWPGPFRIALVVGVFVVACAPLPRLLSAAMIPQIALDMPQ